MAHGGAIGGTIGAIGGSLLPGIGTAVGGAIGSGIGGLFDAGSARKRAEASEPAAVDPLEQQRLNEINQIRRSISTGSNVATQAAIAQQRNIGAGVQRGIARATGGDVGGTVSGFLKAQRQTQQGVNQAIVQGQQRLPFFESLAQQLGTRISQRKLEFGKRRQVQALAETAQAQKAANINIGAGLATFAANEEQTGNLGSAVRGLFRSNNGLPVSGEDTQLTSPGFNPGAGTQTGVGSGMFGVSGGNNLADILNIGG